MTSSVGWDRSPVVEGWAGLPVLDGSRSCDLCVVGLGTSGLAAVGWGVERGLAVVGLDAGRVGGGAAGRNGGFLLGGVARFHHKVVDQLGEALAVDLYRRTLAEIDRLEDRLGPRLRRTGSTRLAGLPGPPEDETEAQARAREEADCRHHLVALRGAGIDAEWFEGGLGPGVRLADDAVVNPAERCLVEASDLVPKSELFEHSPASGIELGPQPRVVTAGGTVTARAVVVAVDGGLERLVPALAHRVRTARLQMLATAPLPPLLDGAVYCRWGFDYAQQTPDGRLMVGGGRDLHADDEWLDRADTAGPAPLGPVSAAPTRSRSDRPHAARPTEAVQGYLDGLVRRFVGGVEVSVVDRWAGLVAFTDDGLPVCELVAENVAAAGAYNGTGNVVGPLVARAAAALALGERPVDWPLASTTGFEPRL